MEMIGRQMEPGSSSGKCMTFVMQLTDTFWRPLMLRWGRQGSNLRPGDYESPALTN